ncbi:MAG: PAS domain-containing protein [Desulfovibrio sp.]|jgi:signal transduction histidine kinase|nr:PAS domain-containing protein [Desulfovibrio sp.]
MEADKDLERREEVKEAEALARAFSGSTPAERKRLDRIVDLLPCYVALVDSDHRIISHNAAFAKFFGDPGEKPCYAALRGQSKPCRICPPLCTDDKKGNSVMEWVQAKSGMAFRVHSYPFKEADGTHCILKAGFNITTSLHMRQALDLSEQSYRAITDNLSIGIALLDISQRVRAGNVRLGQWFGASFRLGERICGLAKCGGQHERAVLDPKFYCPDCPFYESLQDGLSHEKEYASVFQNGKERTLRLVTCPVKAARTDKTQVRAMIMMLEDITGRLRINQQLQRARKVEAMNSLAGGIAHEINQPLSALHLYAGGLQMLLERDEHLPLAVTRERLNLIMREADKIRSIIANMRALVKQEGSTPLAAVSIPKAVSGVLSIMKHRTVLRKVHVRVDMPTSLPLALSNEVQLEQVLVNLLSNAMYALDSVSEGALKERCILLKASALPELKRVRLEVADSGPGIPEGSERIFDPFYTTRAGHGGMGLGLSIVYGLVSLWGGEISVAPHHQELGGAAFQLDMKEAEPPGEEGGREERRRHAVHIQRKIKHPKKSGADGEEKG